MLIKKKILTLAVIFLVINLLFSALLVGAAILTYNKWAPWVEKNILKQANDSSKVANKGGTNEDSFSKQLKQGEKQAAQQHLSVPDVVEKVSPAVVSIIITKDLPKIERYYEEYNPFGDDWFGNFFNFRVPRYRQNGTEKREIGGGTGFIVTSDGLIITNKHVVDDPEAEYTVLMNDETKYKAKVLARDPVNDIAVLKIDKKNLPTIKLGDSDKLRVGQTVIAIGNALGEFRNTVSVGIISGLKRDITASSAYGKSEELSDVIQTDAAINPGNSGGPLLNLAGEAIGINVAVVRGSENIGFALPINEVKSVLQSVKKYGRIVRPWLGVRYVMINKNLQQKNSLPFDYGALILRGQTTDELAVIPGSPADKVGLVENDIILEVDGKKLSGNYSLSRAIARHKAGDKIKLKVYHKGKTKDVWVTLEERK